MYQTSNKNTKPCPNCAETLQAAAIFCRFCHRGLSAIHHKKCPHCAEMVRKSANRCRFCQSDLSEPSEPPGHHPQGAPVPRKPINPVKTAEIALPLPLANEEIFESISKKLPQEKQKPS
jgi:Double zinc ribbon